jgi:hypothetical protein
MAAITSYAAFAAALAVLPITGVRRKFTSPPASVAAADLPAIWPGLPYVVEPQMTFTTSGGWPAMKCDLIVALEPVGLNTQSANYADTIAMMDTLSGVLRSSSNHIGRGPMTWTITANVQINVAGNLYWAVIATIEIR